MSNVEAARAIYAKWAGGDFTDTSWMHDDIEFSMEGAIDVPEPVHGSGAVTEVWREYLSAWEDFHTHAEDFVDLGDRVLVVTRFGGRAKFSGMDADSFGGGALFVFRDGRVAALRLYNHLDVAYEELGIPRGR